MTFYQISLGLYPRRQMTLFHSQIFQESHKFSDGYALGASFLTGITTGAKPNEIALQDFIL
jgi:hypothetical protein